MKEDKKIQELESNLKKLFELKRKKKEMSREITKKAVGHDRPDSVLVFLGSMMIICISFFPTFTIRYIDFYGKFVWVSPIVAISLCVWWIISIVKKEINYDKVYNKLLENDEFCVEGDEK